eukprot:747293-Hanusia_phi.AAC.4
MPLDTVNSTSGELSENAAELLPGAKEVGADGIMVDVWWGLCEQEAGRYTFSGYLDLLERCQKLGLQVQAVMSFHACGGNIGDSVNVPLPGWVLELEEDVPELFYRDQVMGGVGGKEMEEEMGLGQGQEQGARNRSEEEGKDFEDAVVLTGALDSEETPAGNTSPS